MVARDSRNNCGGRTIRCAGPRVLGWIRLQPDRHAKFFVFLSSYSFLAGRTVPDLAAVENMAKTLGSGREHHGARQRSNFGVAPCRSRRLEICTGPVRVAQYRQDPFSL